MLDGFTDSAAAALLKKLDKDHPELATASALWRRQLIGDLAQGAAEPAPKAPKKTKPKAEPKEKTAKPARSSKPKAERALSSKAMAAKWDGKDRED